MIEIWKTSSRKEMQEKKTSVWHKEKGEENEDIYNQVITFTMQGKHKNSIYFL